MTADTLAVKRSANPRIHCKKAGFEFYSNFTITRWLHFKAALQLVQEADEEDDFAVIPGGRLVFEF